MAAHDSDSQRLVWWILGALLAIAIGALSWWGKDLQARLEASQARYEQRFEALNNTNSLRGDRLIAVETKVSAIEPRLTALEGKVSSLEPRLPLVESKISQADARLQRIEQKIDELLTRRQGR